MKDRKLLGLALAGILLLPASLAATQTAFWKTGSFQNFLKGNLQGVSVSMNGQLTLAPETRAVFNPDETVALSMAADSRGNIYVGTGHQGKVFELDSQTRGHLLFQAPEPEILALAVGPDGDLYVGSSPEGKIYRVAPDGKSSVFYDPKVRYIWALAFDAQGRLYAGTGDRGQIFRINRDGQGKVFFASNQTHIICLALGHDGNLLAGSEPAGLVYRITPEGKAFVLYQANLPEIHALATDAQGRIYVAAMGSSTPSTAPGYYSPPGEPNLVAAPAASVTVVASADGVNHAPAPNQKQRKKNTPSQSRPSANPNVSAGIGSPFQQFTFGRGELIQISPDYAAQTLWTSNKEGIFGLSTRGQEVFFSTDADGHIYDLHTSPDGPRLTLLSETRESIPTRILAVGQNLFIATSNIAKLIQIGATTGTLGTYESPVKDTKFISRWGHLFWRAAVPTGCSLQFYARSGNSARPDNTWSDWTGPYSDPEGSPISSTPARYVQWKAVFHGSNGKSPELREVALSYLNQNLPPEIRSFTISQGEERITLAGTPIVSADAGVSASPMGTVTVSQLGVSPYEASPIETAGPGKPPIIFSWEADDPNGDRLSYDLYLRSADEQQWHLLKDKLSSASFTLQPSSLANGEYQIRLVASDAPSNPAGRALRSELVSSPFWVDNTAPAVTVLSETLHGGSAVLRFQAVSQAAPLRKAEVSVGENQWRDIVSDDGIVDSRKEAFTVKLGSLQAGEHVVSLRATDTAGNVGIGKAVIHVP